EQAVDLGEEVEQREPVPRGPARPPREDPAVVVGDPEPDHHREGRGRQSDTLAQDEEGQGEEEEGGSSGRGDRVLTGPDEFLRRGRVSEGGRSPLGPHRARRKGLWGRTRGPSPRRLPATSPR